MFQRAGILGRLVAELAPVALLTAATVYAVGPFLTDRFHYSTDAHWYYCLLTDALQQSREGVFPVRVGQSEASWNGHPIALLPGFVHTAIALDFATGCRLSVLEVMHLTGLWGVWFGAISAYVFLRPLAGSRWLATALAGVYACCPAVLDLLVRGDMFPSITAVPYIPPLFYGLVRGARRADAVAVACVAAGLAALWMAHAGIALWCTTGMGLFLVGQAAFSGHFRRTVWFAARSGALFLVLSVWFFGTIFALGLHQSHSMTRAPERSVMPFAVTGSTFANELTVELNKQQLEPTIRSYGYATAGLLAFASVVALRTRSLELRLFVACALGLIAALIPGYSWAFWANLPRPYLATERWPSARFCVILAGLAVFAAALVAERFRGRGHRRLVFAFRRSAPDGSLVLREYAVPLRVVFAALSLALLAGVGFGLREVGTIREATARRPSLIPAELLPRSENLLLSWYNWISLRDPQSESIGIAEDVNVKEFRLYGRLLALDGTPLTSNAEVAHRGPAEPFAAERELPLAVEPGAEPKPLVRFRIEPNRRYLLTLRIVQQNAYILLPVEGGTLRRVHRPPPYNDVNPPTVVIPIWTTAPEPHEVRVSAACTARTPSDPAVFRVESIALTSYDPESLPVRLKSHRPYAAEVRSDRPCYLETHREFVPGYEARVNGGVVAPVRGANGMLLVPVAAGDNEVVLVYRGPLLSRVAFGVSCLGWLAVAACVVYWLGRTATAPRR